MQRKGKEFVEDELGPLVADPTSRGEAEKFQNTREILIDTSFR